MTVDGGEGNGAGGDDGDGDGRRKIDLILVTRVSMIAAGVLLAGFGVFRLLTEVEWPTLFQIGIWLAAAIILHDLILAPSTIGVGWVLRRCVPVRARRYLQAGLIISGLVTVIALPMIYLRGSQPAVKALLLRNYGANLALISGVIAVIMVLLYVRRVRLDRRAAALPPA